MQRMLVLAASFSAALVSLPGLAAARASHTIEHLKTAIAEVDDADRDCRKRVGRDLEDALADVRDAADSVKGLKKALRTLEGIADDARDDCPRGVRDPLKDAIRALEREIDELAESDQPDRDEPAPAAQEQCAQFLAGTMSGFHYFQADKRGDRGWSLSWPNGKLMRNYNSDFASGGILYYPDGKALLWKELAAASVFWPDGKRAVLERSRKYKKYSGFNAWAEPNDPWINVETVGKGWRTKVSVNIQTHAVSIWECSAVKPSGAER